MKGSAVGINVRSGYKDLLAHKGHKIECVTYGNADNVALECVTCGEVLLDFDPEQPAERYYAEASWCAEDVQTVFDVTTAEAEEFLTYNGNSIQEAMIAGGWAAIETLGDMEDLKRKAEEDE